MNLFVNIANILTLSINSTINIVDILINIAKQIDIDIVFFIDFLFRIQRVYKKNKNFLIIIKTKKNREKKISVKLIKKNICLKFENCEIKFNVF